MIYLQARGVTLVASSPEILCRVEGGIVTNRPLAGTRRRGADAAADAAAEADLLADEKERAEHVMLVDLGRNDVGRVAAPGTVSVDRLMDIERYSHVMHISSTVTGTLAPGLGAWDALRAALPAGTVSGAPKVGGWVNGWWVMGIGAAEGGRRAGRPPHPRSHPRHATYATHTHRPHLPTIPRSPQVRAMQIIDGLERSKRGPYGGGVGHVSFTGGLDMALALRTMVVPTAPGDCGWTYAAGPAARREWKVYIQAGAGVVADSVPLAEYEETVNKAAALGRAVDVAEAAFVGAAPPAEGRGGA